jgi:predicted 3-demethylubiquinone-9 3-methyltransferase (glyoxalase superfamily)
MTKNTICLWYDKDAEAAARFYAQTFPDSAVGAIHRAPSDYPSGKAGDVIIVGFTVASIACIGLNGGPARVAPCPSVQRRYHSLIRSQTSPAIFLCSRSRLSSDQTSASL